jgi:hypothetical protein
VTEIIARGTWSFFGTLSVLYIDVEYLLDWIILILGLVQLGVFLSDSLLGLLLADVLAKRNAADPPAIKVECRAAAASACSEVIPLCSDFSPADLCEIWADAEDDHDFDAWVLSDFRTLPAKREDANAS